MKAKYKTFQKNALLYVQSLMLVFKVSPLQSTFLLLGILVQGLVPSLTILLSCTIITEISKLQTSSKTEITFLCFGWGFSLLLSNLIEPWVLYLQSNLADRTVHEINVSIIKKSNSIEKLDYFESPEFFDDVQILNSQSNNKPINLIVTSVGLIKEFVIIMSNLLLLLTVIPWIGIIAFIGAYINFKTFSILQRRNWQESLGRSVESRRMNYLSNISTNAQYAKEIRFFNFGLYLLNEYKEIFKKVHFRMKKLRLKQAVWPILPIIITLSGNLLGFIFVVRMALNGSIQVGAVVLFVQALSQLHLGVTAFGEQAGWLQGHVLFFEKFFKFLSWKENNAQQSNSKSLISLESCSSFHIEFKDVNFYYSPDVPIIKNVSFTINPFEKIAIVGLNGSGKSTLIKLLCGLYTSRTGNIRINGFSLEEISVAEWRSKISPVFQDFNSYSLAFETNITMSSPTEDSTKIYHALMQAGANDLLNELPENLKQQIGKDFGGAELSKGQWQKVALARALYKDSPIYILDEPTSSMDPISEYEIYQKFSEATKSKTVIFVTHRLSSVLMADRILLFHKGELVAEGSHKNLMETSRLYKEMFDKQAKNYLTLEHSTYLQKDDLAIINSYV